MSYYFATTLESSFDEAVERVTAALQERGFGILTQIDVQATLREKIGVEMDGYLILGACNPSFAHKAIESEPHIGLLLPCNITVRALPDGTSPDGQIEVAAVDPEVSMGGVDNAALGAIAGEVRDHLKAVIASL